MKRTFSSPSVIPITVLLCSTWIIGSSYTLGTVLTSFIASFLACFFGVPALRKLHLIQAVRNDGPALHIETKADTPTVAGILFLPLALVVACIASRGSKISLVTFSVAIPAMIVGMLDDLLKAQAQSSSGLPAYIKLCMQAASGLFLLGMSVTPTSRALLQLWPLYCGFLTSSLSNGTNLTDGLDGLCAGVSAIGFAALALLPYTSKVTSPCHQGSEIVALSLSAACCGFLCVNAHPAEAFMGDTGSLALGCCFAALSANFGWGGIIPSFCISLVFAAEAASVIVQVASFKLTGKRLLRMAPFHHHMELCGTNETGIVCTCYLGACISCILGLTSALALI